MSNFELLTKASLFDLKKLRVIKSVSINKSPRGGYLAKIEDYFATTIEILVGRKSWDKIDRDGITKSLEDSAYIVLIDESDYKLRITFSDYASTGIMRELFQTEMEPKEREELLVIKDILLQKGLKVQTF